MSLFLKIHVGLDGNRSQFTTTSTSEVFRFWNCRLGSLELVKEKGAELKKQNFRQNWAFLNPFSLPLLPAPVYLSTHCRSWIEVIWLEKCYTSDFRNGLQVAEQLHDQNMSASTHLVSNASLFSLVDALRMLWSQSKQFVIGDHYNVVDIFSMSLSASMSSFLVGYWLLQLHLVRTVDDGRPEFQPRPLTLQLHKMDNNSIRCYQKSLCNFIYFLNLPNMFANESDLPQTRRAVFLLHTRARKTKTPFQTYSFFYFNNFQWFRFFWERARNTKTPFQTNSFLF